MGIQHMGMKMGMHLQRRGYCNYHLALLEVYLVHRLKPLAEICKISLQYMAQIDVFGILAPVL
jgi:hypothetical protein